jgi:hypothetical protein
MDFTSTIIISLIVSAFGLFAGVLAYADYATRQARRAAAAKASAETAQPVALRDAA